MGQQKIIVVQNICEQCGHIWIPRAKISVTCPGCQSLKWDCKTKVLIRRSIAGKEALEFLIAILNSGPVALKVSKKMAALKGINYVTLCRAAAKDRKSVV